jgi:hypothetical protein
MGDAISEKDSTAINILLKSKYYDTSKEDKNLFNINNIPESIRQLNTYLASRIHVVSMASKSSTPKRGTGITVTGAKLSLCRKILAAELPHSLCITFSYFIKLGSRKFYMYRQVGPLNYFMDEDLSTLEIPFIMLLNLFEQRYDADSMDSLYEYGHQYTKEELERHRVSLLIKDMTEEKYDTLTVITPEEYARKTAERAAAVERAAAERAAAVERAAAERAAAAAAERAAAERAAAERTAAERAAAEKAVAERAAAEKAVAEKAAAEKAAAEKAAAEKAATREAPAPSGVTRFQVSKFTPNY